MSQLPNFLVVGAPKAGTTSISRYLREHPQIYLPQKKGLHYFTHQELDRRTNGPGDKGAINGICRDLDSYRNYYAETTSHARAIGDASPSYLFFSECIPRIKGILGNQVKILILLRNPFDRAFSNYLHLTANQRETLSFHQALLAEDERALQGWGDFWCYRGHSLYANKVYDYLQAFGPDQVHIIDHDGLAKDTSRTIQNIYSFLEVDDTFVPHNINIVYGRTGQYRYPRVVNWLNTPRRINSFGVQIVPRDLMRWLKRHKDLFIENNTVKQFVTDKPSIDFLTPHFRKDLPHLEEILKVDLKKWEQPHPTHPA